MCDGCSVRRAACHCHRLRLRLRCAARLRMMTKRIGSMKRVTRHPTWQRSAVDECGRERAQSPCRYGRGGGPSPGSDVGGGERSPGADVGGSERSPGADVGGGELDLEVRVWPRCELQAKPATRIALWRTALTAHAAAYAPAALNSVRSFPTPPLCVALLCFVCVAAQSRYVRFRFRRGASAVKGRAGLRYSSNDRFNGTGPVWAHELTP